MKESEFTVQVFKSILVTAVCCYTFYSNTVSAEGSRAQNSDALTGTPQRVDQATDLTVELAVVLAEIRTLASRGEYTQALSEIDQLIEITTGNPQPVFVKATILESMGKPVEAAELYRKLTINHPELAEPFNNLAVHYMKTGDYESAMATLEAAFEGHQGYATIFNNLQSIYDRLASNAYRKALDIEKPQDALELVSLDQIPRQPLSLITNPVHSSLAAPDPTENPGTETSTTDRTNEIIVVPVPEDTDIRRADNTPGDVSGHENVASVEQDNFTSNNTEQSIPIAKPTEMDDLLSLSRSDSDSTQGLIASEYKSLPGDDESALSGYPEQSETIRIRVESWADAWSTRDLDRYLSYYSNEFVPRYNLTLDQWKKHQHALWRWRKLIVVELSDVSIDVSGNDAIVKFTQYYKSKTFENTIGKTLELKQKNGSWYITREFI